MSSSFFDLDEDGHRGRGRSRALPSGEGRWRSIWSGDRNVGSVMSRGHLFEAHGADGKSLGIHPSRERAIQAVHRASR